MDPKTKDVVLFTPPWLDPQHLGPLCSHKDSTSLKCDTRSCMPRLLTKERINVAPKPASPAWHSPAAAFPHPAAPQEPRMQPQSPAWLSGLHRGHTRSTGSECHEWNLPGQLVHLKLGLFWRNDESAAPAVEVQIPKAGQRSVIPRHPWLLELAV